MSVQGEGSCPEITDPSKKEAVSKAEERSKEVVLGGTGP